MTDRYAVMGHPIAHSRSPFIHARFAEQTGEAISYQAIDVAPGDFTAAVARFRAGGGKGLNVTVPYKGEAFALCAERTAAASSARAVNTIWFDARERACGDNTDGTGLVRDLEANHGVRVAGLRVLLIGAGGAASGVVGPLLERGPACLLVANRSAVRAQALAARFASTGAVRGGGFGAIGAERFDLVINATSAGLGGERPDVPESVVAPGGCCYDMVYGAAAAAFLDWARAAGAAVALDGVGMLVEQAADAFSRWRGVRPDTRSVIDALRHSLASG